MDYAIQLLIPVLGGLMMAIWMNQKGWLPSIWVPIFPILGLMLGIGVVAKRLILNSPTSQSSLSEEPQAKSLEPPSEHSVENPEKTTTLTNVPSKGQTPKR